MKNIAITFINIGKSCRDLAYEIKLQHDDITRIYRLNYKTANRKYHNNINNIPNIEQKYEKWKKEAQEQKKSCNNGDISPKEFEQWFKDNKNWHIQKLSD